MNQSSLRLVALAFAALTAGSGLADGPTPLRPIDGPIIAPIRRCPGVDPVVASFQAKLVNRYSSTRGRVQLTAKIKNYGMQDFVSRAGQQSIQMIRDWGYGRPDSLRSRDFAQLNRTETITLTYSLDWTLSNEFPPEKFTVYIGLDPDIYMDGNKLNDDCRQGNNVRHITREQVDALFN